MLHIVSLVSVTTSPQPCDPAIEQLLTESASVYATPSSLPPCKGHKH